MPVEQGQKGVAQEMRRFKAGKLHSRSSKGPLVKNPKRAIAIALNASGMSKGGYSDKKPDKHHHAIMIIRFGHL